MQIQRRRFFNFLLWSVSTLFSLLFTTCKSKQETPSFSSCDDFSQVPESDQQLRSSLAYTDLSPIEASNCGNCNLWLPPQNNIACGGCTLFAGPVATEGYCTYWAPQVIQ